MTTNPTRATNITMSDGTVLAKIVWAFGQCTVITEIRSYREPRLDCDNDLAVRCMIHDIRWHDPANVLEFLWSDLLGTQVAS